MSDKAPAGREQTDVDYRVQVAYKVPVEVIAEAGNWPVWEHGF